MVPNNLKSVGRPIPSSLPCSRRERKVPSIGPIAIPHLLILSMFLLSCSGPGAGSGEPPSRDTVQYTAWIDGDGKDADICLAGFRDYTVNISFSGLEASDVRTIEMDIEEVSSITGNTIHPLLVYTVLNDNLTQSTLNDIVLVDDFEILNGGPIYLNISFAIFFHLSWDLDTSLRILPRVRTNSSILTLDTPRQLSIQVWGDLDLMEPTVTDGDGRTVEDKTTLRSGTMLSFNGLVFSYVHPSESFSSFSPEPSELLPTLNDSTIDHPMVHSMGSFNLDTSVPSTAGDKVTFLIRLEGIRSDWLFRVRAWRFEVYIDDTAPVISLKRPGKDIRSADEVFQYEVQFQDFPAQGPILVNGSSLGIRFRLGGSWSDWTHLPSQPDARTISYMGEAVGLRGEGNTSIQFRAMDQLGNSNTSLIFPIVINVPPVLTVPGMYNNSVWPSNSSLSIDGRLFAYDADGEQLQYKWYILDLDINPLSMDPIFNRSLFNLDEGLHTVKLVVNDEFATVEVTFNITVKVVEKGGDGKTLLDTLTDRNMLYLLIPVLLVMILAIVIPVIIIVHRRSRDDTDFVVDENNVLPANQAEEMARKLRELYEASTTDTWTQDQAEVAIDDGEFDFDYDLYELLGVERSASGQEIKRRYRDMAAFYHPDRVAQHKEISLARAVEHMIKINKAKEVLLNPEARQRYDASLSGMDFSIDVNDMGEGPGEQSEDWS